MSDTLANEPWSTKIRRLEAEIKRQEKEVLGLHMAFNQAKRVIDEMAQGDKVVRRTMDEVVELRAKLRALAVVAPKGDTEE